MKSGPGGRRLIRPMAGDAPPACTNGRLFVEGFRHAGQVVRFGLAPRLPLKAGRCMGTVASGRRSFFAPPRRARSSMVRADRS